jgi:hypothetical protein
VLHWLQGLVADDERLWRLEINTVGPPGRAGPRDPDTRGRYFQVRAYDMEGGGWCCGEGETLVAAITSLRDAVERKVRLDE